MGFKLHCQSFRFFAVFAILLVSASACSVDSGDSEVFIKGEPAVNGIMEYSPRSLRVYLTELPDVDQSSLRLTGPEGEVPVTNLHTMGANDLMAEIDRHPLPNGAYVVHWTVQFVDGDEEYSGSHQFQVAAPE
jgi:methionine-rich copper-binding protein CopC